MEKLKQMAETQNTSVNFLILKLIEKGIGFSHEMTRPVYHDLDKLAGTWSPKEAQEFQKNTKDFEKIDQDLWE